MRGISRWPPTIQVRLCPLSLRRVPRDADVRLYDSATLACATLQAHTGDVLTLHRAQFDHHILISGASHECDCSCDKGRSLAGAKDNTICVWRIDDKYLQGGEYEATARLVAFARGHTKDVVAVAVC